MYPSILDVKEHTPLMSKVKIKMYVRISVFFLSCSASSSCLNPSVNLSFLSASDMPVRRGDGQTGKIVKDSGSFNSLLYQGLWVSRDKLVYSNAFDLFLGKLIPFKALPRHSIHVYQERDSTNSAICMNRY